MYWSNHSIYSTSQGLHHDYLNKWNGAGGGVLLWGGKRKSWNTTPWSDWDCAPASNNNREDVQAKKVNYPGLEAYAFGDLMSDDIRLPEEPQNTPACTAHDVQG